MRTPHRIVSLIVVAAAATMIASCGDDEQDAVEVTATDFRFEGLPERIEAGTEVTMRNASSTELHELIAFRLPDGEQRSADELMSLPEEELGALFAGPPPFGLVAAPGESSTPALGDGTFTEPGRYLVFCAIPTGADPAEAMAAMREAGDAPEGGPPAITGGPPHFVHGMYAELFVE